jgi:alpha/beta superfamily hydrolase
MSPTNNNEETSIETSGTVNVNPDDYQSMQKDLAEAKATIDQQDKEIASLKAQLDTQVTTTADEIKVTDSHKGYIRQLTNIIHTLAQEMHV